MSPLCIRGSTRMVSTLWDIPRSSPNLVIQTFLLILAWRNARCFHPVVSSILCYLTITLANSPFHSVFPAWPRKCPNPHTDLQRQLIVTWCIPDLLKAIEKGYTVVCAHKCGISWPLAKGSSKITWTRGSRSRKRPAGGQVTWVTIPWNVNDTWTITETEGIELDPENIEKNPGLHTLAKMMLNSM